MGRLRLPAACAGRRHRRAWRRQHCQDRRMRRVGLGNRVLHRRHSDHLCLQCAHCARRATARATAAAWAKAIRSAPHLVCSAPVQAGDGGGRSSATCQAPAWRSVQGCKAAPMRTPAHRIPGRGQAWQAPAAGRPHQVRASALPLPSLPWFLQSATPARPDWADAHAGAARRAPAADQQPGTPLPLRSPLPSSPAPRMHTRSTRRMRRFELSPSPPSPAPRMPHRTRTFAATGGAASHRRTIRVRCGQGAALRR